MLCFFQINKKAMNSEEKKSKTKPKRLDYRTPKYREYRKALRKKERDYITLLKTTIHDLESKINVLFEEKCKLEALVFTLKLKRVTSENTLSCDNDVLFDN